MKTISADYNALTESDSLRLGFHSTQEEMRAAGVQPQDWAWLSDGEVIVGAQIMDDPRHGLVGVPEWKTLVHLDDEDATDFERLWSKLSSALREPGRSAEQEAELFRLLTIFEQVAPPAIKAMVPPGYLALRRAGALHFLGESGLALHEVRAALQERPHDPDMLYFFLELLLRDDPDRAAREAEAEAEKEDTPALVLAACIDIWSAAAEQLSDEAFASVGRRVLRWADRFESAPGRERVRAFMLASVQFNRGLILLRLGPIGEAQATLRLAHATDPKERIYDDASGLDAFDDRARHVAARFRERPLPLPSPVAAGIASLV
jgi:hypothetical protein